METHLIIGYGQVGQGLAKVLRKKYRVHDKPKKNIKDYDMVHVCYGYHNGFIEELRELIDRSAPKMVVVHSTVEVGTMDFVCRPHVVYSPVRGKHPHLAGGIKTFVKYLAGRKEDTAVVAKCFKAVGIKCVTTENYRNLELGKLLDTTYYGWNIVFMKEVEKLCAKWEADFDMVYTQFNKTYNEGYTKLKMPNVVRPVLSPMKGKIGGHCVMQNCELLKHDFDLAKIIRKKNKRY